MGGELGLLARSISTRYDMTTILRGLKRLLTYLIDFGAVLVSPKRLIAGRLADPEEAFVGARMFLSCSFVVMILLWASIPVPGTPIVVQLAGHAVEQLIGLSVLALVVWGAWAAVGARSSARAFFVVYAYFAGVIFVMFSLCLAVAEGIVRIFEPDVHQALQRFADLPHEGGVRQLEELGVLDRRAWVIAFLMQLFGSAGAVIWALICWGAFRQLHGVGRWRSLGAMVIAGSFAGAIVAVTVPAPPFPGS